MPLSECNSLWNKGLKARLASLLLFKGEALHSFSASLHSRMQGGGGGLMHNEQKTQQDKIKNYSLSLQTLSSISTFSIMFLIHFLWY